MNITSIGNTLTAAGAHQISAESLSKPLNRTLDKILSVITLGIYGAYRKSVASEAKNALLDLGMALVKWDPAISGMPVKLKIENRDYEISDMPNGVRLLDRASGKDIEVDGVSLASLRDMIFSEIMNHPDFSNEMERRIDEDTTPRTNFVGLKQERANACGDASRNMILAYHGIDYAPATNSRGILEGTIRKICSLNWRTKD